jgi:hypothetical protein
MNPIEEMKLICAYILAVASSQLPSQLKWELIFCYEVSEHISGRVSLHDIYGVEDKDWDSHEEEVQEYAVVIAKLLKDLEKVDDQS